jgi:preprotein translocase subunit SecE
MSKISQWFTSARTFLGEVKAEWKKVTSPSRREVVGTTIVVIVTSVIFSVYLWAADIVILQVYEGVISVIDKVGNVLRS